MTDDVVKSLREFTCDCFKGNLKHLTWEAADRIELLEKQLLASDKQIEYLEAEIENLEYEMCEMENRS